MKKIALLLLSSLILLTSCGSDSSEKVIIFEKPDGYKEIIDNSVEPNTIQQTTSNNSKPENTDSTPVKGNLNNSATEVIVGTWIGEMSGKKLTIVVEKINGNDLVGYNILGTNRRNLKGAFTETTWDQNCSKAFEAVLNEPGDDNWDGVFTVKFVGYEDQEESDDGIECIGNLKGQEAIGEWKSNNGKMKKNFNLVRKN